MLSQRENPAAQSRAPSASGQFADRFTYWSDVEKGIASGKANFDSVRAAVRAVVESKVEVQS
jgi:hypothetical protein